MLAREPVVRERLRHPLRGRTPPEVEQADRLNCRVVANVMYDVFSRHFPLPDIDEVRNAFYYFIEVTDLIFALSVIEHGEITADMLEEAERVGAGYLACFAAQTGDRRRQRIVGARNPLLVHRPNLSELGRRLARSC